MKKEKSGLKELRTPVGVARVGGHVVGTPDNQVVVHLFVVRLLLSSLFSLARVLVINTVVLSSHQKRVF